ncbi:MAG: glycosyltransferase [candidate division WWE3 bacterium]|nr:glycosyltransferase [candidate division WWE3 bacterium]
MRRLEIDMPVYNEEVDLPKNIPVLYDFCVANLQNYDWSIKIVDNASKDNTWNVVSELSLKYLGKVSGLKLDRKGRGWALRQAWTTSKADYVSYMDIDLSSDLATFPKLLRLLDDGYDMAVGSRNMRESEVIGRTLLREIMSRTYITLVKLMHGTHVSDTQCGFKALRRSAFIKVEPVIENNLWFFDSEMVILFEKVSFKVKDVPIKWVDDRHTTVKIAKDSYEEFSGLTRLLRTKPWKALTTS